MAMSPSWLAVALDQWRWLAPAGSQANSTRATSIDRPCGLGSTQYHVAHILILAGLAWFISQAPRVPSLLKRLFCAGIAVGLVFTALLAGVCSSVSVAEEAHAYLGPFALARITVLRIATASLASSCIAAHYVNCKSGAARVLPLALLLGLTIILTLAMYRLWLLDHFQGALPAAQLSATVLQVQASSQAMQL